jgi:lysozyme
MFSLSPAGEDFIARFEGEILRVYLDPVGLPTLGIGHLLTPAERQAMPVGTPITKEMSRKFFRSDIARFESALNELVTTANQNQVDALLSLMFNIGEAGFKRSSVLRYHRHRNYAAAANAFLLWNKAGGRVLKGLVNRRKAERELYLA